MLDKKEGKYIIFHECGDVYLAEKYTEEDFGELGESLYAIIRLSDNKSLDTNGEWCDLTEWHNGL